MSFRKIGGQLNFHLSNAAYIYNQFVSSCSTEKKARTGHSIEAGERGGKIVCHAGNKLRFGTLKLVLQAIVKSIRHSDVCKTGIKYIIREIVHK